MKTSAKGALRAAWKKDFRRIVGPDLDKAAEVIVNAFRRCVREKTGKTPAECMREAIKEAKLGDRYREIYSKHRAELKGATAFDWQIFLHVLGDVLRDIMKGRVAEAFRKCMAQTEKTAADCYREAAEEAKIGEEIKKAWSETDIKLTV